MIKIISSACINANVKDTWSILSQVENINLWSEPVLKSYCSGSIITGVGVERTCVLKGGIKINEKWVAWEEGKSFTYMGYNIPLTKSAKNTWSVIAQKDKTLLTSEAEIVIKGGYIGRALEPIMLIMAKRMGADAMAAFKYLVEKGKPYRGKHSTLARAPVKC